MRILIIPAGGQGQRFRDAGFKVPKPLIEIRDPTGSVPRVPMLVAAGRSFDSWADEALLVIPRDQQFEYKTRWGEIHPFFGRVDFTSLKYQQEGAALTVLSLLGEVADDDEVLVVNSDQFFIGNQAVDWCNGLKRSDAPDGSLLTFEVEDLNDLRWSYAQTAPHRSDVVTRVAEKLRISSHATAGAYYFRQWKVLRTAICRMVAEGERYNGEFYLAPVYNQLIRAGMQVTRYDVTGHMVCVGTPEQLRAWEDNP